METPSGVSRILTPSKRRRINQKVVSFIKQAEEKRIQTFKISKVRSLGMILADKGKRDRSFIVRKNNNRVGRDKKIAKSKDVKSLQSVDNLMPQVNKSYVPIPMLLSKGSKFMHKVFGAFLVKAIKAKKQKDIQLGSRVEFKQVFSNEKPGLNIEQVEQKQKRFDKDFKELRKDLSKINVQMPEYQGISDREIQPPNLRSLSQKAITYLQDQFRSQSTDWQSISKVVKYLNFFSRLPDYLVTRMLPSCELRVFLKDSFIWQKGTYCEAFYIMLKGSANIEKFYASINSTITINSIYDGEMFGDWIGDDQNPNKRYKRRDYCRTQEICYTFQVNKNSFLQAISYFSNLQSEVLQFLQKIPCFQVASPLNLQIISNSITKQTFILDDIIYKVGDIPQGLHIIYKGRVKLSEQPSQNRGNIRQLNYQLSLAKVSLPQKLFFGQRVLWGDFTPVKYMISATSARVEILTLKLNDINAIFEPFKTDLLLQLRKAPSYDVDLTDIFSK